MALPADAAMAAGANGAQPQAEDIDWSSVDQVSQLVSRTTMAAMQQLWRQHASGMDELGREYAERMYESHSQAVRDIAEVKNFDLRRVLQLLNSFTESTRELVLDVMQEVKQRDDEFTQQLYQTTRGAFSRNLRAALEARDAWYREKLRGLRQRHDSQLAAVRHAAAVELQQRQMQLKIALARTLAKSARGESPGFVMGILGAARNGAEGGGQQTTTGGGVTSAATSAVDNPSAATASGATSGVGAVGAVGTAEASVAMRNNAAALAAVAAASSTVPSGGLGEGGNGPTPAELGPEAAMLEELFEDANAADALNRELEASLGRANTEIMELRDKLEAAQTAAQEAAADAAQWRSKWAVESTKTDSIKRESMAIIAKCEEHLTQLQQHHIAEISQRDYLLQRCRDTITALESRLQATTAATQNTLSGTTPL